MPNRMGRRLSGRSDDDELTADALALAAAISAAWRETLEGIFKTGDLLITAKATVPYGQWEKYVREQLPFKVPTARRLIAIAGDKKLRQESIATHLPICWYTLWELTTLTEEQFERGLQAGAINPNMLRADVEPLKGRWVPGASISPRMASSTFSYKRLTAGPDPVIATRAAYFKATVELSADENERELAACYAHFKHGSDDDDD